MNFSNLNFRPRPIKLTPLKYHIRVIKLEHLVTAGSETELVVLLACTKIKLKFIFY
uniref:Uncharacterized protein n=1 Tax=Rhizophora mucronata TaxID=61149 RepID=A0A2P2N671_RHIMU